MSNLLKKSFLFIKRWKEIPLFLGFLSMLFIPIPKKYDGWVDAYSHKGKLYLDCHHPSNWFGHPDEYVDTIVKAYQDWKETK